ncbi:hypothetical protein L218DRAFT_1000468 [Marasmius fiardii PR-910]|nr:hypothetical protein L218DRAFT_1000468 [Marasmius fiardii PR-910]
MTLACIEPNPDISGIGVRVSIYTQALLSLVHPAISAWKGELVLEDIESLRTIYQGSLIIACALLFSAFIQVKSAFGLSLYHVLIVLNLSWLSSSNAIIYTLYILLWWCVEFFKLSETAESSIGDETTSSGSPGISQRELRAFLLDPTFHPELASTRHRAKRGLIVIGGLTSIHLIIVGVLGVYVWFSNITSPTFRGSDCASGLSFPVFAFDIPITSPTLRRISLAVYFMMVVPVINLYIFLSLLGLVIGVALIMPIFVITFSMPLWWEKIPDDPVAYARMMHRCVSSIVLMASVATQAYFIINNEQFIAKNAPLLDSSEGTERDWTFGQTLAIGILVVPMIEVYKAVRDSTKRDKQKWKQRERSLSNEGHREETEMERWLNDARQTSTNRRRRNSC